MAVVLGESVVRLVRVAFQFARPARRQRNVLRFWGRSTRDGEKSVKLSLGDFYWGTNSITARIPPQIPVTSHYHRTGRTVLFGSVALTFGYSHVACVQLKGGVEIWSNLLMVTAALCSMSWAGSNACADLVRVSAVCVCRNVASFGWLFHCFHHRLAADS